VTLEGGCLIPVHGHIDASSVVVQAIGVPRMVKPFAPGGQGSAGRIPVREPRSAAGGRDLCHVGGASELPQQGVPVRREGGAIAEHGVNLPTSPLGAPCTQNLSGVA